MDAINGQNFLCVSLLQSTAGNLVAFAKLLAGQDHPVGEVEHGPCEEARAIHAGLERDPLQTDLLCFFQYS